MHTSILLVSGSTRDSSTNTAALRAAASNAPETVTCSLYNGLAQLPHFNPDDEEQRLPGVVQQLRDRLEAADAVLISTPEYAGAMPGALKNLLEWTIGAPIGGGSLYGKPVGWVNGSPRPDGAQLTYESLRIVLGYAHADIVEAACVRIPVPRSLVDATGAISDTGVIAQLGDVVTALAAHVRQGSEADDVRGS